MPSRDTGTTSAIAVEYTSVDSLDTVDAIVVSARVVELSSNAVSGGEPRTVLWIENAAAGQLQLAVGEPSWLMTDITASNNRTPTSLIIEANRSASDTVGVYATTLTITGGSGVPPAVVALRLVMAGPTLDATADEAAFRTWVGRTGLPTQPVIVSNGGTERPPRGRRRGLFPRRLPPVA